MLLYWSKSFKKALERSNKCSKNFSLPASFFLRHRTYKGACTVVPFCFALYFKSTRILENFTEKFYFNEQQAGLGQTGFVFIFEEISTCRRVRSLLNDQKNELVMCNWISGLTQPLDLSDHVLRQHLGSQ